MNEAMCTICDCYVSIKHKGAGDIEKHVKTEKHLKMSRSATNILKIDTIFQPKSKTIAAKQSAAEVTLAFHTVKHHQSYKSMDCTGSLLKVMFSDSNVASSISCARTKTEALVNNVIAPWVIQRIQASVENVSYVGVSTDASNHGAEKMFPILIQFFDWQEGIQSKLLEVLSTPNETSETVAEIIKTTLEKYELLAKCVSFTGDNANVNFGGVNRLPGQNVWSKLKTLLEKDLVGVGCPAHILHNCAQHGTDTLKIDLESVIMKIFNYFSVYTVRTEALKEICDYIDINYHKLLYHSKTRWLSLFPAIERVLQMYEPLKQYFATAAPVPVTIKSFLDDELSEVYLYMVHSLMSIFQPRILEIETESNSILDVARILRDTQELLCSRANTNFLPLKVRELLGKCTPEKKETFLEDVKILYRTCIQYLDKWTTPLADFKVFDWIQLKKSELIDFEKLVDSVIYMKGKGVVVDDVKLFDEITAVNSFLSQQNDAFYSMMLHKRWVTIFKNFTIARLPVLLSICEFIFAIQAQNASVERVFSLMGAQWTKERNKLTVASVRSLMMIQYNLRNMSCEEFYKKTLNEKELLIKVSGAEKYKH